MEEATYASNTNKICEDEANPIAVHGNRYDNVTRHFDGMTRIHLQIIVSDEKSVEQRLTQVTWNKMEALFEVVLNYPLDRLSGKPLAPFYDLIL